jgi:hypothetical protein
MICTHIRVVPVVALAALLSAGAESAGAEPLVLEPIDMIAVDCDEGQDATCIEQEFGPFTEAVGVFYKAFRGGAVEGLFADSYQTVFLSDTDAEITHLSGSPAVPSSFSYYHVKDGQAYSPNSYLLDLSLAGWNGTDPIVLSGFWGVDGAKIESVAIWGPISAVPEPATLTMLVIGLAGAVARGWRRRRTT